MKYRQSGYNRANALHDQRWNELLAVLRSDRDRAILALGISPRLVAVAAAGLQLPERFSRCCSQPGYCSGHYQG